MPYISTVGYDAGCCKLYSCVSVGLGQLIKDYENATDLSLSIKQEHVNFTLSVVSCVNWKNLIEFNSV